MTSKLSLIAAAFTAFLAIAAPQAVRADEFSTNQRGEVERIVREYLIAHPEVIQEAMVELEKRQSAADAEKHKAAVKQYSQKPVHIAASGCTRQSGRQCHVRGVL